MSSASESSSRQKVPLESGQRVLHVLLGGIVLLGCAGLFLLLGWITLTQLPSTVPLWGRATFGTCALVFALAAGWGGHLVARGMRGFRLVSERALRLDRALLDPSSPLGLSVLTLVSLLAFVLCDGRPGSLEGDGEVTALWYLVTCGFWLLPAVTLHEFGHAAAASALGLGWTSLRIGPLEVLRAEGRTRVHWHSEGLVSLLGFVRTDSRALYAAPSRMAWVALAGPAASLLGAGVHAALAYAQGGTGPGEAHGLAALLWGGAFLHAGLGLVNLTSFELGTGQLSDGALWLALRQLEKLSEGTRLVAVLNDEFSSLRPREWSPSVDAVLTAAAAPGESAKNSNWLHLLGLAMLLDRADFPAARALLKRLMSTLETLPPPYPQELLLQGSLLQALGDAPDAARARVLVEAATPHDIDPLYPRLAEAAVLLCEGQLEAARAALLEWESQIPHQSQWCIGNQWALERLRAALGVTEGPGPRP